MDNVNKTLYIPLYGKAYVSRRGILLRDPRAAAEGTGLAFLQTHEMTPAALVEQLQGMERTLFRRLYAGGAAKKLYRLYEYGSDSGGNPGKAK